MADTPTDEMEAAIEHACFGGDEYACDFRKVWKVTDALRTELRALRESHDALAEAVERLVIQLQRTCGFPGRRA